MMTIDEAIMHCEEVAENQDKLCKRYDDASGYSRSHNETIRTNDAKKCEECAKEHRQLAEWLRELQRYRFEISECKAILDNPTPDVTENDKKRAMFVLQTFPDIRGDSE